MGDGRVVALPEPRPEDDEDVVWGLSTANALWARGERNDALVWLRRAADAANAAGQSFRASELGLYATELEETAAEMAKQRSDLAPTAPSKNYGEQPPAQAREKPNFASTLQSAGDSLFDGIREAKAVLRSEPPRGEQGRPAEARGRAEPASQPPGADDELVDLAEAEPLELADTAASPADVARALMPSLTDDDETLVRRLPTVEELAELPPPPDPVRTSPAGSGSLPPARPASEPPPRIESEPPPASTTSVAGGAESAPSSATLPAASVPKRRRRMTPILDPWSEPDDASRGPSFLARRAQSSPERLPEASSVEIREDSVVVSVRSRPAASAPPSDDADVVTSAATLDSLRRRSGRVPPPPPPSRAVRFPADSEPLINTTSAPPPAPTQPEGSVERVPPSSVFTSAALPAPPTQPGALHAPPPPPAPTQPGGMHAPSPPAAPTQPGASARHPQTAPPPPPPRPASAPPPPPPPPPPPQRAAASVPPQHTLPPPTPQSPVPAGEASRTARLAPDPASVPSKSGGLAPAASGAWVERTWSVEERSVGGLPLERADALSDLPHAAQAALAASARIDSLGPDEEVSGFGVALVVGGDAAVCATIVDAPAERVHAGAVVPSRGNLGDAGVALRVVAGQSGARVAVWDLPLLEAAIAPHPLVSGELRDRADRLQALAGTTMGPLGDLDETYRNLAVERLVVRLVRPGEVFVEQGMTLGGLAIVGAGELELHEGGQSVGEAGPGDLLFPGAVLQGLAAPATARAGPNGALLLVGERALAQELLVTVPPLVEILSAGQ